jgi:hypothetical protein
MLRKLAVVALASALLASGTSSAFAAGNDQAALAPGKPAGVHEAHRIVPYWVYGVGAALIIGGVAFTLSSNSNGTSGGSNTTGAPHL